MYLQSSFVSEPQTCDDDDEEDMNLFSDKVIVPSPSSLNYSQVIMNKLVFISFLYLKKDTFFLNCKFHILSGLALQKSVG